MNELGLIYIDDCVHEPDGLIKILGQVFQGKLKLNDPVLLFRCHNKLRELSDNVVVYGTVKRIVTHKKATSQLTCGWTGEIYIIPINTIEDPKKGDALVVWQHIT